MIPEFSFDSLFEDNESDSESDHENTEFSGHLFIKKVGENDDKIEIINFRDNFQSLNEANNCHILMFKAFYHSRVDYRARFGNFERH